MPSEEPRKPETQIIRPVGIPSEEAVGTPRVRTVQYVRPVSIPLNPATAVASGRLLLETGDALLREDGGAHLLEFDVEVKASWLAPRPLTDREHDLIILLAGLTAMWAESEGASGVEFVTVGLLVYRLLTEFTSRFLKPME